MKIKFGDRKKRNSKLPWPSEGRTEERKNTYRLKAQTSSDSRIRNLYYEIGVVTYGTTSHF